MATKKPPEEQLRSNGGERKGVIIIRCFIKFAGKDEQLVVKADKLDVVDGFETSSSKVVVFLDGKIVAIAPMIHVECAYLDIG